MFELLKQGFIKTFIRDNRYKIFVEGFKNTLIITIVAAIIGIILGVIVSFVHSLAENARDKRQTTAGARCLMALDRFCSAYVAVMRGTPLAIQLMIMTFIVMSGFPNKVLVCCLAFGINSGAYVSENIRAGISSVDPGQMEAGRALGLSWRCTMLRVILPQAVKNIIPAIGNEMIALLKETSIISMVGATVGSLTFDLNAASNTVFRKIPNYLASGLIAGVFYLAVVYLMVFLIKLIEKRMKASDKR